MLIRLSECPGYSETDSIEWFGVTETLDEASAIFEQILRRKENTDSMRTSLSILHKFRFLFNLPVQIEHNVKTV